MSLGLSFIQPLTVTWVMRQGVFLSKLCDFQSLKSPQHSTTYQLSNLICNYVGGKHAQANIAVRESSIQRL